MDDKEINTIVEEHGRYLLRLEGGKRATFNLFSESFAKFNPGMLDRVPRVELGNLVLRNAVLIDAGFCHTDLSGADFRGADLRFADFYHADLSDVDFRWADLRGADLRSACLEGANFLHAKLAGATMSKRAMGYASLTQNQRDSIIEVED